MKALLLAIGLGLNTWIWAASQTPVSQSVDPDFKKGLSVLRKTTGIIEGFQDANQVEWASDLQLLIGVKASEGAKRTINFIELSTIPSSLTNLIDPAWDRVWHTNRFTLPAVGTGTNMTFEFAYRLAPVRVRVVDQAGKTMREGEAVIPWELMTNSLAEVCRLCLDLKKLEAITNQNVQKRKAAFQDILHQTSLEAIDWDKLMRPIASGFLSLHGLFAECISTPALNDICEKAQAHCVIRLPSAKALFAAAFGAKLDLSLDLRLLSDVSVVEFTDSTESEVQYSFPGDLKSGNKKLVGVEFIVGCSRGAGVMLGGIRRIRAVHPTKPNREFVAQVLVAGKARLTETSETREHQ